MTDLFSNPKRRVARAKEHIDDLESGIKEFLRSQPYGRRVDVDPETGNKAHKVALTEPLPDRLLVQAMEVAEGLRAALDKAGFAAAHASGNTRLKSTYFPIADTAGNLDNVIRGRCKDLPQEVVALFRSFKAHKAGNPLLWGLNQLANGSKHRILIPVGVAVGNAFMETYCCAGLTVEMGFPPRWDSENDEMVLCVVGPDAEPHYNMSLQMFVQIKQVDGLPRAPASTVFRAMASEVERVVVAAEAETIRLFS